MEDIEDRVSLQALDPATADPGFWVRFHARVLDRAQQELARRRAGGTVTIPDVVFAWRRPLVPAALLAATLAGIFLMSHEEPVVAAGPVALEEALIEGLEGEPIPAFLDREWELEEVAFLASVGGF